jgi:hypothetical protein
MDDIESSVANCDAGNWERREIQLVPDRGGVETACQAAATALDAFLRLAEGTPGDDSSIVRASAQFNTTLAVVRRKPCETLADLRAKRDVLRQLEEILPPDDPRLQFFTSDLVQDIVDFLEIADVN